MTILGVPVLHGLALDNALEKKIDVLEKAVSSLKLPNSHDELVLLKNSISMPHLLYTLGHQIARTIHCFSMMLVISKLSDPI